MPENLENSAVATGLEKVHFHSNLKKRAMPKSIQTTVQLYSFHMLERLCLKSFKLGFSSMGTKNFQMYRLGFKSQRNQRSNCQHSLDQRESKGVQGKHLLPH